MIARPAAPQRSRTARAVSGPPSRGHRRGSRCSVGHVEGDIDQRPAASLRDLLRWSESLAAIARTGLGFTTNLYERERYEEVLHVAGDIRSVASAGLSDAARSAEPDSADGFVQEWLASVGKGVPGYVTPKIAIGAAVGNERGELLLIQRADSGVWLYPTGWADVGYSASEVAAKEVLEETGLEVEPVRLIMVLDGLRLGFTHVPLYSLVFLCRPVSGELRAHPLETRDVGWFGEDTLPSPLAGAGAWAAHVFASIRGDLVDVYFDLPRSPTWRSPS